MIDFPFKTCYTSIKLQSKVKSTIIHHSYCTPKYFKWPPILSITAYIHLNIKSVGLLRYFMESFHSALFLEPSHPILVIFKFCSMRRFQLEQSTNVERKNQLSALYSHDTSLTLIGRGWGWINPHFFEMAISSGKKGSGGPKSRDLS